MPDLAVRFNTDTRRLDLLAAAADNREHNGLVADGDLETAILASLFTWALAEEGDKLPNFGDDRKGYWADAYAQVAGRRVGSRLWLLARRVLTTETVELARQYCAEALAWLIEDGIAERVNVTAARAGVNLLTVKIEVVKPQGAPFRVQFDDVWQTIGAV